MTEPPVTEVGRPRRRTVWALVVTAVVIVLAVLAVTITRPTDAEGAGTTPPPVGNVAPVVRGQLTSDLTLIGTVQYDDRRVLPSGRSGVLTALPAPGTVVGQGGELYRVDDVPVLLLHGRLPAWRDIGTGMTDGPDVLQLETALSELGYFGATPDAHFSTATYQAIRSWQRSLGLERTGALVLGSVFFSPTDLRLGAAKTAVGSRVEPGAELLDVSATSVGVTADVGLPDQGDAPLGARVQVRLPGGGVTTGTVSAVLPPVERDTGSDTKVVVPVVVTLDDASAVAGQDQLTVSLTVTRVLAEDVLQVPVSAVLALAEGGYGVQVRNPDGTVRTVPVALGAFGGGLVAVDGDLSVGDEVVTP